MAERRWKEMYITQAPSLQDTLRVAEYPKLEALFLISRQIIEDKKRPGMSHHVLKKKYACGHHEYQFAKWLGKKELLIENVFDDFLASNEPTIKQYLEHKVYGNKRVKSLNPKLENLNKAWNIINQEAKLLYDNADTKRDAYLLLEQVRTRLNHFMPINCELSDFEWFINQDCCACGKEPEAPYGNHIIKLHGVPVPICPRCKKVWDETQNEDMLGKDEILKTLWRYTKSLEQTLNIING
jgi:hypothetical protein